MASIRAPAVAGTFYPGNPQELDAVVAGYLAGVSLSPEPVPKAIIAPHAGYIYSAPVAATVYARLKPAAETITRVILLGPSHKVGFKGMALTTADCYRTPLGDIPIDKAMNAKLSALNAVGVLDQAHVPEHSLEVHLPFLQKALKSFTLVPVVVGQAEPDAVADLLEAAWGGPETLIVISTDLSHYLDYGACQKLDLRTTHAIENLDATGIGENQACGRIPVRGLLTLAKRRGLRVKTMDVRNSGDTAGPRDQVVGYGAWAFYSSAGGDKTTENGDLIAKHGETIVRLAAASIKNGLASGRPLSVDAADYPSELSDPGACFVTLEKSGDLRGCIGSPQAWQPLLKDLTENAFRAAFGDPRFPKLQESELPEITISVSILTPPEPLPVKDEIDALNKIRPGIDGLIMSDQGRRGLFLPQVWDSLPTAEAFLTHLKRKAGLPLDHWSPTLTLQRFESKSAKSWELVKEGTLWGEKSAT